MHSTIKNIVCSVGNANRSGRMVKCSKMYLSEMFARVFGIAQSKQYSQKEHIRTNVRCWCCRRCRIALNHAQFSTLGKSSVDNISYFTVYFWIALTWNHLIFIIAEIDWIYELVSVENFEIEKKILLRNSVFQTCCIICENSIYITLQTILSIRARICRVQNTVLCLNFFFRIV